MTTYNVAVDKGTNRRTYQRSISARIINPIMNWLRYRIIKLRKLYLLSINYSKLCGMISITTPLDVAMPMLKEILIDHLMRI